MSPLLQRGFLDEKNKRQRLGADADQPHRIKYRPLVRS